MLESDGVGVYSVILCMGPDKADKHLLKLVIHLGIMHLTNPETSRGSASLIAFTFSFSCANMTLVMTSISESFHIVG
jgi:hypothetical protein